MEVEIKSPSILEIESKNFSPYTNFILGGHEGQGTWLTPQYAYWLWEKSDSIGNAVDKIAWGFQQIEPVLIDKKTNQYVTDHDFLELLKNPGMRISDDGLLYDLMTSFCITGECFPVLIGNVNFEPIEIYSIGANNSNLIEGKDGFLDIINFTANYNTNIYKRETISNRNMWIYQKDDKLSETIQILIKKRRWGLRGQSVLERIYYQALTKYYGAIHNSGILKNGSRPGGLWSPKDGPLSQEQYEAFKKEVQEKFSGPTNAGRNVVAPRPTNYENFLVSPRDMDFVNLIDNNRSEIYTQYDIPLPLVLPKTMTMNNYQNAVNAFYDMSLLPRAKFLFKQVGRFALPRYKDGDRFELSIDEKEIPALKARLFERAETMSKIYVFSDNEIRTETAYEARKDGDKVFKPANLVEAGEDDFTEDLIDRD